MAVAVRHYHFVTIFAFVAIAAASVAAYYVRDDLGPFVHFLLSWKQKRRSVSQHKKILIKQKKV